MAFALFLLRRDERIWSARRSEGYPFPSLFFRGCSDLCNIGLQKDEIKMKKTIRSFAFLAILVACSFQMWAQEAPLPSYSKQSFDSLFYQGVVALSSGKYAESERLLKQAYALDSLPAALNYSLAKAIAGQLENDEASDSTSGSMVATSRLKEVKMYISRAYQRSPSDLDIAVLHARMIYDDQPDKSLEILKRLMSEYPDKDEIRSYYIGAAIASRRYEETLPWLKTWLRDATTAEVAGRYYAQVAEVCNELGRSAEIVEEAHYLVDKFPNDEDLRGAVLLNLLYSGQHEEAAKQLKLFEKLSNDPTQKYVLRSLYLLKTNAKKAYAHITKGFSNPQIENEGKLQIVAGLLSSKENRPMEWTEEFVQKMVAELYELYSSDASIASLYLQGLLSRSSGEIPAEAFSVVEKSSSVQDVYLLLFNYAATNRLIDQAHRVCQLAQANMPLDHFFFLIDAVSYSQNEQYEKGKEVLDRGIANLESAEATEERRNQLSELYAAKGDLYDALGERNKTYECYEKAITVSTKNENAFNNYAYMLAEEGQDLPKALQLASHAYRLNPESHNILDTYGYVYYRMGNWDEAERYYRMALETSEGKTSAVLYDHLGDTLLEKGQREAAMQSWLQALELTEGDKEAIRSKIIRLTSIGK